MTVFLSFLSGFVFMILGTILGGLPIFSLLYFCLRNFIKDEDALKIVCTSCSVPFCVAGFLFGCWLDLQLLISLGFRQGDLPSLRDLR